MGLRFQTAISVLRPTDQSFAAIDLTKLALSPDDQSHH